jgi:hypothetical protein
MCHHNALFPFALSEEFDVELWKAIISVAVQSEGFPKPEDEHEFHPERKWRFDLAWPSLMVAFEKEGMAPVGGKSRHTTRDGFAGDCEKYNAAQLAGWVIIRGTSRMIESGEVVDVLLEALNKSGRATTSTKEGTGDDTR